MGGKQQRPLAARHKTPLAKTIDFILLSPIALTTAFPVRLSRRVFHPRRLVSGAAESTLGKNLIYLHHSSASRMCLAVILAGRHAFFACFACHLGSPPSLRSSRNLIISVVFFGQTGQAKSEAKASPDDSNTLALPCSIAATVPAAFDVGCLLAKTFGVRR